MNRKQSLYRIYGISLILGCSTFISGQVANSIADQAIEAFNNAFLVQSDGLTYYRNALNSNQPDGTWTLALDIFAIQDTYERTGKEEHKTLINELCNSFAVLNPIPYTWNGWNDDLAWMGLVNIRGYQATGSTGQLEVAEHCFNLAYNRGWNTIFNDGGIWEQQPDMTPGGMGINKEALSNNPNGHLACLLYESTGNEDYLSKAIQIYNWSKSHLFNPTNGQVYTGVERWGEINKSTAVYNQGSFIDFANHLYKLTGDETMLRDAQLATDFVIKNLTRNGILSNDAEYLDTWADTYARGVGHLCMLNPHLWNTYYPFLKQNAVAAWANRHPDLNLTWNAWDRPTPVDVVKPTKFVSATALMQFVPTLQPIPGTIQAENYNYKNGISIEENVPGQKLIASKNPGDWLEYIIEVPATDIYTLEFQVAGINDDSIKIQQNNITLSTINIPTTGNLNTYTTVSTPVKLLEGVQSLKIVAVTGGISIDHWTATMCQPITPEYSINEASPEQSSTIEVSLGDKILLTPKPANGSWSWTGPNNYSANSREIIIDNIQFDQGGNYQATYQSPDGCINIQDYMLSIDGCPQEDIVPYIQVNNGQMQPITSTTIHIEAGSYLIIDFQQSDGISHWTGPNGFYSESSNISFLDISYKQAGIYTFSYTNHLGCKSTQNITLVLSGTDPCSTPITTYYTAGNSNWQQSDYISVNTGNRLTIGPHPIDAGSWSWTGPNGFSSFEREITINNFNNNHIGAYTATFTNDLGCVSTKEVIIGWADCASTSIIPEIQVNGHSWTNVNEISLASGGSLTISPPDKEGIWNWTGPYGFTSDSRELSFNDILGWKEGAFSVSLINEDYCISSHTLVINVTGDEYCSTPINPYLQVNNEPWQNTASAALMEGDNLTFGPHPLSNIFLWSGPNEFETDRREFTLSNINVAQQGVYKAVYNNSLGCRSYANFLITVDNPLAIGETIIGQNPIIKVYPNPASDYLVIEELPAHIPFSVLNIAGQTLIDFTTSYEKETIKININNLEPGVYFIKSLQYDTNAIKFIKK